MAVLESFISETELKALRKELFAPTVAEHHGRIVKQMVDGALVEFPSVVDAVECAVAVQRGMAGLGDAAIDGAFEAFAPTVIEKRENTAWLI